MHRLWRQSVQALLLLVISLILGGWPTPTHADEITVSTAVELANTVGNSAADDTILLEDGEYALSGSGTIVVRTHGLTIRSKRGRPIGGGCGGMGDAGRRSQRVLGGGR